MTFASVPWLELAVFAPLAGALIVSRMRDPLAASRWCLGFSAVGLACAVAAWGGVAFGYTSSGSSENDVLPQVFVTPILALDALNAPLVPLVALLHFLTALATARTKMSRFSFAWLLIGHSLRVATFACAGHWLLGVMLVLNVLPPYFELVRRGRPTRVYMLHMGLFVGLLLGGLGASGTLAAVLLMMAVLVRSGTFPAHVWVTDLFENASFGSALLFVTPITGMYMAARLVLPSAAPEWVLEGIAVASLVTALYSAAMAVIQTDARRFFAYLFLSHASLVLVGLELQTTVSLTGALMLWASVMVSLSGLGLTLRAIEARFGQLGLTEYRGLYDQSPALTICFLLTGLASVGFPGTSGFIGAEMLVDGAVGSDWLVGAVVIVTAALNGIAVLRVYFLLFTGHRHVSSVSLGITRRELVAVLVLAGLILGGGLFPQLGMTAAHRAAHVLLKERDGEHHGFQK